MAAISPVGFDRYYTHAALTEHLQGVAAAAPGRVRLHDLYTTAEGRPEWLAEVTDFAAGPTEERPAYLVHANVHAPEVSGTTAALVLIEHLLTDPDLADLLQDVVFYVVPRVNPDGAEYALTTGGAIRSKFEYRSRRNGLIAQDLDGDGLVLSMRWQSPFGMHRVDDEDERVMVSRHAGDPGPFYHVVPEGLIENYDGGDVHEALRSFDFNRNWGYNWQPEHIQWGAGDYAFSNRELRAVADWVRDHPAIFGMLGFHNGCNSVLRPSATVADEDLNASDLRVMKQLGEVGERLTGFKLRAVRDYRGEHENPLSLKGHFTDWGYFGLGLHVFEIELGCVYNAAGISSEEYFAADPETRQTFMRQVLKYVDAAPGPGFVDWHPFEHPQLGPVEIGGLGSVAWATPPPQTMRSTSSRSADFICEHARHRPRLEIHNLRAERIEGQVWRVQGTVGNSGGLPTQITEHGRSIAANGPVRARLLLDQDMELLSRSDLVEVPSLAAMSGHIDLEWFVRAEAGAGVVLEARAPKAGLVRQSLRLGA